MKEGLRFEGVEPVRPLAPYIGGKRALAKRLVERIDATAHDVYAEPFVGMGGVFFRRRRRPRKEVINDISADVVNLFRLLQRHYQQLLDVLKWQVCSRAEFERLMAVDPVTLTDLERAARFLYLQRTAFGGKVTGRNFGVTLVGGARFDLTKLVPMLEDVHDRLCGVDIERLPYGALISRYDRPGTLFYLDPPYHGCEGDYGAGVFSAADFEHLRGLLEATGALHHVDQRHARDPRDLRRLHDRGGGGELPPEREGDAGEGADYQRWRKEKHHMKPATFSLLEAATAACDEGRACFLRVDGHTLSIRSLSFGPGEHVAAEGELEDGARFIVDPDHLSFVTVGAKRR